MAGHGNPPKEVTPHDADIIWRFDLMDEVGIMPHDAVSCSVLIHGDFLYTSTSNGVGGMPGETFFSKHAYVVRPEAPAISCSTNTPDSWSPGSAPGSAPVSITHSGLHPRVVRSVAGRWSSLGAEMDSVMRLRPLRQPVMSRWDLKLVWSYDCNPPEYRSRDGKLFEYYDGDRRKTDVTTRTTSRISVRAR